MTMYLEIANISGVVLTIVMVKTRMMMMKSSPQIEIHIFWMKFQKTKITATMMRKRMMTVQKVVQRMNDSTSM